MTRVLRDPVRFARRVLELRAAEIIDPKQRYSFGGRIPDDRRLDLAAFEVGICIGAGLLDRAWAEEVLTMAGVVAGLPAEDAAGIVRVAVIAGSRCPLDVLL